MIHALFPAMQLAALLEHIIPKSPPHALDGIRNAHVLAGAVAPGIIRNGHFDYFILPAGNGRRKFRIKPKAGGFQADSYLLQDFFAEHFITRLDIGKVNIGKRVCVVSK